MIFDRIMLPAQGRNEDYKFAQTGSVTLVASAGGPGGGTPTPSWLENVIKIDPESGFLSVQDWHVKGSLIIEGQVNQWLAQQLVVDDARIQVNRKQDGVTVDSGLVIYNKDTSSEVSALVYDVNGVWKAGGEAIASKPWVENSATAYNAARLGGYVASSYPRKAEAAVITGAWAFEGNIEVRKGNDFAAVDFYSERSSGNLGGLRFFDAENNRVAHIYAEKDGTVTIGNATEGTSYNKVWLRPSGHFGIGTVPTERLHVAGNGLFTGNLTAVNAALSGTLGVTGNVTAGAQLSSPTYVSGFAGSGWRIDGGEETQLTVDRLTVRQRMDVYELAVNQIRGTNGAQWVSDSAKVASVSGNRLTIDTGGDTAFVPFAVNDLLRCQRWNGKNIKYYVVRVTAVGSNYIDVVLVDGSSPREAGDHLVRMGNTEDTDRQGALYLTSSDSNAPYMDVLDGVNSASFAGKTKVRIGKLDGITDPDLGELTGYGLYTENGYFKGKITVTGGNAATKADVDAVQVGGRNLIPNSIGLLRGLTVFNASGYAKENVEGGVKLTFDAGDTVRGVFREYVNNSSVISGVEISGFVTTSMIIESDEPFSGLEVSFYTYSLGHLRVIGTVTEIAPNKYKCVATTELPEPRTGIRCVDFYLTANANCTYLTVRNLKLELGNKATDWTPAPEDVDAGIAAAQSSADTLKDRVENRLGLAQLESIDQTLITGNKIRTSLLEVNQIAAQVVTAQNVEGLTLNFTKGKIGDFEIFKNPAVSSLSTGTANMRTTPYASTAEGMALYTQGTDKRIVVKVSGDNYVDMRQGPYGWGLYGVKDGATIFRLGSTNQIAGINFDDSKLSTSNWELNKDGSFSLAGGKISGTAAGAVTIDGSLITQHITTNYIEGLELNFNKGKIGGFNIDSDSLTGGSTGDRVVLYPRNYIAFLSGDDYKWAGLGNNVCPATTLTHAVGRFHNARPTAAGSGDNNVGVYIDVKGAGSIGASINKNGRNTAIYIENGDIYIRDGSIRAVREYVDITMSGTVYNYLPVHRSFKFNIYSAGGTSYNEMRLPTKEQVESHFGTTGTGGRISFDVLIVCNYESTKPLRIAPNPGVEFKDTGGNSIAYHGMAKGDTVKIIFLHNHWQISAISQ